MPLVSWLFGALVGIVALLLASIALDLTQIFGFIYVFLCHFGSIDPSSWMSSSLAFLVVFVFLGGLGLGLSLKMTCITREQIVARLNLVISVVLTGFILLICL